MTFICLSFILRVLYSWSL